MSEANVELVWTLIDAFNREDLHTLAELSDDDLEFDSVVAAVETGGAKFQGPATWPSYFAHMHETWEAWKAEDVRVFDAGEDRLAAVFHIVGVGRHSGAPVDQTIGITYQLRAGKFWRMRSYLDSGQALEAVGLSEEADVAASRRPAPG